MCVDEKQRFENDGAIWMNGISQLGELKCGVYFVCVWKCGHNGGNGKMYRIMISSCEFLGKEKMREEGSTVSQKDEMVGKRMN